MAADPTRSSRFELVDGPLPPVTGSPVPGPDGRPGRPWAVLVLAIAVLLLVLAVTVLPRRPQDQATPPLPTPSAAPSTPGSTGSAVSCDLDVATCRVAVATRWRNATAAVLREHLDPDDTYFTGYSYSASPLYDTGPGLEVLGLEVYRLEGGGTEVFIQIAKSRADAVRCGTITHHRCTGQRFMDGNRFSMTTTTSVEEGIEVQHMPLGTYVITLVARNTTAGQALELNNGDLMAVAQDPRLQPPPG